MPDPDPIVDLRPRVRRAAPAGRRGAGEHRRLPRQSSRRASRLDGREPDARPRRSTWRCARPWRTTRRSSSWARTSASSAASSGSPTGCRRTSARTASSTPRSPSPASSARRSAWRCAATGRSCEIQFDGFVYPAFDQIVSQLAKMHARSGGKVPLPVVIRIPFGGGIGAVEHHSESPEAYFAHTAGLRVVVAAQPGRRVLDDPAGHRLRRPGHLLRAEAPVLGQGRARPGGDPRSAVRGAGRPAGHGRSRSSPTGRW